MKKIFLILAMILSFSILFVGCVEGKDTNPNNNDKVWGNDDKDNVKDDDDDWTPIYNLVIND